MGYKTVIFDMDGTILDTLGDITDSVNASMRWAGAPEKTLAEVRASIGSGARKLIERCLPDTMQHRLEDVLLFYRPYYETHAAIRTQPYPGIPEQLEMLRNAGVRVAVASNKPAPAVKQLAARYFPGCFDIAIGERTGLRPKPAPDLLLVAMQLLRVTPEETVYIGDSDVDVMTAAGTGVDIISAGWGYRDADVLRQAGASVIAQSPDELFSLITGA